MKYVQISNTIGKPQGVRCLISIISIRSDIDYLKCTYFNLSKCVVTYIILWPMASKQICKFVKINVNVAGQLVLKPKDGRILFMSFDHRDQRWWETRCDR